MASRSERWRRALFLTLPPALAFAHERWVPHEARPFDILYFRTFSGEPLKMSIAATLAVAGVIAVWYLAAAPIADILALPTADERAREARRPLPVRAFRAALRFALDGDLDGPRWQRGLAVASFVFSKIPAAVLALGVAQNWIVMPSFPLHGTLGQVLRVVEGVLAAWCLWGRWLRALGITLFAVFGWLIVDYGIASIDAIPVLGSAFFYTFALPGQPVNARQLGGIRISLGIGFMLLGLVNKIWHAELFIGVGDQFPRLLDGPRHMFPHLTREAWSFGTALSEMTFGLLLLLGLFDKLTTIALSAIFTNFVFIFGWAEIVHLYPIAGFALLFFRAPPGTVLDGVLFRTHVGIWRRLGHPPGQIAYRAAVVVVALVAAAVLMLGPLFLFMKVIPNL